ncbi:hypothetical protein Pla110_27830 [Polystyrenella longa]|uniref:Sulfotransferase domain protein n=1 Tax=Polystyrenella longa TaxID=2528007 RepID=A0A518CP89_9PLAN|nr:hypothetical protein [Polystyrenella longa]QDU81046.1 hypothetical protein Pla110_27830 [Polystyrenella longa]
MITLALGIPRSATTWAFNVCRHLYDFQGLQYKIYNPTDYLQMEELIVTLDQQEHAIIHGHDLTPNLLKLATLNQVRPFFNYRNPCDVVVSQIKLHDLDLETAIQITANAYTYLEPAMAMPGIMLIPYEHATSQPESIIYQMATKLSIFLPLDKAKEIAEETSYAKHKKVMDEVNREGAEDVGTLYTSSRKIRFSETHLINDRHLQSGKNGRWREELTPPEQERVLERFTPLLKALGFESDIRAAA